MSWTPRVVAAPTNEKGAAVSVASLAVRGDHVLVRHADWRGSDRSLWVHGVEETRLPFDEPCAAAFAGEGRLLVADGSRLVGCGPSGEDAQVQATLEGPPQELWVGPGCEALSAESYLETLLPEFAATWAPDLVEPMLTGLHRRFALDPRIPPESVEMFQTVVASTLGVQLP